MITVDDKKINWEKEITIDKFLNNIKLGERFAVVRLNGKLISRPNFKSTIIKNHSEIILLPMISGG